MPKKQTLLFILLLAVFTMAFSGCTEQPKNNQVNNDNQQQEEQQEEQDQDKEEQKEEAEDKKNNNKEEVSTEIKYLDNGEIDTGDWKTYRNEVYGLTMKYPPFLNTSEKDAEYFGFSVESNWNHHYHFSKFNMFNCLDLSTMEEKKQYCIEKYSEKPGYEKLDIKDGHAFFYHELTKGGYSPTAIIIEEKVSLSAHKEIYNQTPNFDKEDQKYIDIFKASIETIKFDE